MDVTRANGEKQMPQILSSDSNLQRYVLSGRVEHLPRQKAKEVRIFLSSTFSDMQAERNTLLKYVYPKLQLYCRSRYDVEFKVVDMRWGVRSNALNDHTASRMCMAELKNCQKESLGPNFVLLIGQRYGTRALPAAINEKEFDILLSELKTQNTAQDDLDLLQSWYLCDTNAIPAQRLLQALDAMRVDQAEFSRSVEPRLLKLLRTAAKECFNRKLIDERAHRQYFWSITEEEVDHGIVQAADPDSHCLCFIRRLININMQHRKASRFIDVDERENIDADAQSRLDRMKDLVYARLSRQNIAEFQVSWCDDGGVTENSHAAYLNNLCDLFYERVVKLIDKAASISDPLSAAGRSSLLSEIVEHGHQALSKFSTFQGQDYILSKLRDYLVNDIRTPFIVYGKSGFGKTSVVAVTSIKIFEWLGDSENLIVVRRFLGTTSDSTAIEPFLHSIVEQVASYTGLRLRPTDVKNPLQLLAELFNALPKTVKVCIFLDSLDQLSQAGNAHLLTWLPHGLPVNVKLVVSTLPREHLLLHTLRLRAYPDEVFAKVKAVDASTSVILLRNWLSSQQRCLTDYQLSCVANRFESSTAFGPLYVKLMCDIVRQVPSYMNTDDFFQMCSALDEPRSCIMHIFDKLRTKHGEILVDAAFALLHLSNQGLTETELLDILSLDDYVLNDVFQFHTPPLRRLPAVLWTRIRHDVSDYVVERSGDGAKVLAWYHRQFIETGTNVFVTKNARARDLQLIMCEYFRGTWANGRLKPFTYTDSMVEKLQLSSSHGEADRIVPEQPVFMTNGKPNYRKLSQLPNLLVATGQEQTFLTEVVGSIETLLGMFSSFNFSKFFSVFKSIVIQSSPGNESLPAYNLIMKALVLSSAAATVYPRALGPILAGHLLPFYGASALTDHLLEDIYSNGLAHNALVVENSQLEGFGSRLTLEIGSEHTESIYNVAEIDYDNRFYVISVSTKVLVYDMTNIDIVMRYSPDIVDGDHFNCLAVSTASVTEYFATSLALSPIVFVFSVKRLECIGKIDCRVNPDQHDMVLTNMLAFTVGTAEGLAVWGNTFHGVYIYELPGCGLVHSHGQGVKVLAAMFRWSDLIVAHPCEFAVLSLTYKDKLCKVFATKILRKYLPSIVNVTAQCAKPYRNTVAIATNNGDLFIWLGLNSKGYRLLLDSPAHSLTATGQSILVCTKGYVYAIDHSSAAYPFISWRIRILMDSATFVTENRVLAYRFGSVSTFWIEQKEGKTRILDTGSFTCHARPITGCVTRGPTMMTSSTDGIIRISRPFQKINSCFHELSRFDRMNLPIDFIAGSDVHAVSGSSEARQAAIWDIASCKVKCRLLHDGAQSLRQVVLCGRYAAIADAAGLVFIWDLDNINGRPDSVVSKPGFLSMAAEESSCLVILSEGMVSYLSLPLGSTLHQSEIDTGKEILKYSWGTHGVAILVGKDNSAIEIHTYTERVQKRLVDILGESAAKEKVTGLLLIDPSLAITFASKITFYNYRQAKILFSISTVRPSILSSVSTTVAIRSGLLVQFFRTRSGITKLGELRLAKATDVVTLSPDGLHCLMAKAPRLLQLYRLSDMSEIGTYPCYCDVSCCTISADGRHVLVGMSDTRLLSFLIVDVKIGDHQSRLKDILPKPLSARAVKHRRIMLEAAGEVESSTDDGSVNDPEMYEDINDIRLDPGVLKNTTSLAYAALVIQKMWKNCVMSR